MNDVYVLRDESSRDDDYNSDYSIVGIFTTPEKALEELNKLGGRDHEIYSVPLDTVDRFDHFRSENRCKLVATHFRLLSRVRKDDAKPIVVYECCTRKEMVKAVIAAGAKINVNYKDAFDATKERDIFPETNYWGVPLKYEFGELEYGPDCPDVSPPPPPPPPPPAPTLSMLMTGRDLSGIL